MAKAIAPSYLRFREAHHAIAQMFASGWTISKVSRETGYSRRRLNIMLADPAFQDLVAEKAKGNEEKLDEYADRFHELHFGSMLLAAQEINSALQESIATGERLPMRELLAIAKDGADRFGYSAKSVRVNVNADFAMRLDAAIDRSAKVIEHVAPTSPSTSPPEAQRSPARPQARLPKVGPSFIRALAR